MSIPPPTPPSSVSRAQQHAERSGTDANSVATSPHHQVFEAAAATSAPVSRAQHTTERSGTDANSKATSPGQQEQEEEEGALDLDASRTMTQEEEDAAGTGAKAKVPPPQPAATPTTPTRCPFGQVHHNQNPPGQFIIPTGQPMVRCQDKTWRPARIREGEPLEGQTWVPYHPTKGPHPPHLHALV